MAGKGIRIPIVADVREFLTGTRKAEQGLDDFADALDQTARDGDKAAEKLERSFKDAARSINQTGDKIKSDSKSTYREIGTEAGAEFSQNFGEGIRSGNPTDAIVETVTSLGGALGGVGLVLAGAFGIGAAIAKEITDQTANVKKAATGLFEAARQGAIDAAAKEDFVNSILGTESWADSLRLLAPLARQAGVPIGDVVAEIESGGDAVTKLDTAFQAATKRANELRAAGKSGDEIAGNLTKAQVAAGTLAGLYERGADAIAQQNELLALQRDIALNTIREIERAGTAARGVTNFERSEMRTRP